MVVLPRVSASSFISQSSQFSESGIANFDSRRGAGPPNSVARPRACAVSSAAFFSVARSASRSLSTLLRDLDALWASCLALTMPLHRLGLAYLFSPCRRRRRRRGPGLVCLNDAFSTSSCVFISRSSSRACSASSGSACCRFAWRSRYQLIDDPSEVAFSVCNEATKPAKRAACRAAWWSWWTPYAAP